MLAPVTHILGLTTIRRERLLPIPGRVVVRKGQKVSATDVVAEAVLSPQHLLLDVARGLGLPADKADKLIKRNTGEEVTEGDVIAGPVGVARRVVRAPQPGRIVLTGNGQVLLEIESHPFELRAGMPGVIQSQVPDLGVVVENTGALVQGVWGNGQLDYGLMQVLLKQPDDVLVADQLDISLRGSVILAGHCEEAKPLETAAELPVRGLILASLSSSLISLAAELRYPIVVLEGFGRLPMSAAAFNLLTTNARREVAVNAEYSYPDTRPEVIIPLPAPGQPALPNDVLPFTHNQRVRVVRAPFRGQMGVLVSLRPGLEVFPSGVRAPAAEIRLENGETALLPLVNIEVVD